MGKKKCEGLESAFSKPKKGNVHQPRKRIVAVLPKYTELLSLKSPDISSSVVFTPILLYTVVLISIKPAICIYDRIKNLYNCRVKQCNKSNLPIAAYMAESKFCIIAV
ncbi:hypothetical protein OIU76_012468 [Salix suchowensis]|nr:hypothetical protein OIU76_012468 [Salix suchowensis]